MGNFRFYRRTRIFPGLSVNLSKSGPSLTMGVRGAHVTVGPRGIRRTVGIPGTGLYYTSQRGYHSGIHSAHREPGAGFISGLLFTLAIVVGIALIFGMLIGVMISQK